DEESPEEIHEELLKAQEERKELEKVFERLGENFLSFEALLPVVAKLASLVTTKSERSTIDLTQNIFSIAEVSKDVSTKIHELLVEMTQGDRSMGKNISRLESEMERLRKMEEAFLGILRGYYSEIQTLGGAIGEIKKFTEVLTDLSERTHILAINASVEAARVGARGAGFAVIAGEVQKLAAHAKEIAGNIRGLTGRIDKQVNASFRNQGEMIDHAVHGIKDSQGDLKTVVDVFAPQVRVLSESISESKRLSEHVTENLNSITVSLQFQDYIRQVVEHIIAILTEQKDELLKKFPADKVESQEKITILEEEVKRRASKYFTIRDEWDVLGLKLQETHKSDDQGNSGTEEYQGDVLLF
ncbi:MAG: hypothetical protein JW760_09290, partial [Spirochaetales bacterium]|nr:hypothetical protein [Spirochaetales bacterium]